MPSKIIVLTFNVISEMSLRINVALDQYEIINNMLLNKTKLKPVFFFVLFFDSAYMRYIFRIIKIILIMTIQTNAFLPVMVTQIRRLNHSP